METIIKTLEHIVQTAIKENIRIKPDDLLAEIVTSSLTFVIILGEIERVFDLEIPEEELDLETDNFQTLNSIAELIKRIQSD